VLGAQHQPGNVALAQADGSGVGAAGGQHAHGLLTVHDSQFYPGHL
jgi:hypothetical protein